MAQSYFASPLSENMEETPEGFLISHDCVIARTGFQGYKVGDLPQDAAARMGVDTSNAQADIDLYRASEDVFAPDTLASFEGKPITDNHPPGFVTPDNFTEYARGHVQNVRRGTESLESGEWPVIADLIITAEPLLSKVRNKIVRELSCGYDFSIRKEGGKILQCDITGNHVAVVPKGRAGSEARINDSAPSEPEPQATSTLTTEVPVTVTKVITVVKERKPVKIKDLIGRGLRALAADSATTDEDLANAVEEIAKHTEPPGQGTGGASSVTDRARAADAAKKKRMHDALDRFMDGVEQGGSEMSMEDKDMDELQGLLHDAFPPEPAEELEAEEGEGAEDAEDPDEGEPEGAEPGGGEREEAEPTEGEDRVPAADRAVRIAARDSALAVLRRIRPFVARAKDRKVQDAFNAELRRATRTSHASTTSHAGFAGASRARDGAGRDPVARHYERQALQRGRAADGAAGKTDNEKLQAYYDSELAKGGK